MDRCLVCEFSDRREWARLHARAVVRCTRCGFGWISPQPTREELERHYNATYAVDREAYVKRVDGRRINEVEDWLGGPGRMLEIGCSYGDELAAARERGWDVRGVEVDARAVAVARDVHKLQVVRASLDEFEAAPGSFDVVVMWHVLEHVVDPVEHITRIRELLRAGGIFGIRVPNIDSFGASVGKQWWQWLQVPEHLWYFSPVTLRRFVEQFGFVGLHVRTERGDGIYPLQHVMLAGTGRAKARLIGLEESVTRDPLDAYREGSLGAETTRGRPSTRARLRHQAVQAARRPTGLNRAVERRLNRRDRGDEVVAFFRAF
jgi:2-polyprenyl-3-methyl-5-hydroxy-6-metoxy-1,4-benzoquinol methylase